MLKERLHENKFKRALVAPFRNVIKTLSKTTYVKLEYKYITHHKCNLKNPTRYTEKLQYLRLFVFPKNKDVIRCASRDGVREYLKEIGEEDKLIPIYGIYDKFDDIDFDKLPEKFVLKCTHACAFNYICLDKNKIDKANLKKTFDKWLSINYGKKTCEMHYSSIKPRIIIEKYIGNYPDEYKFHVFNGKARYLYLVTGRNSDIKYNNYYIDFTPFDGAQFNGWEKRDESEIKKSPRYDEMVLLAQKLAKPFPFVRVDLYEVDGKIYFGEMTFTPAKGTLILDDDECDYEIGNWLDISEFISKKN